MLIVRQEQLEAFETVARERFAREMLARTLAARPELDRGAAAALVETAIARACRYGLEDEADIEAFVDLCRERGVAFEEASGMEPLAALLARPDLPGELKMALAAQMLDGGNA